MKYDFSSSWNLFTKCLYGALILICLFLLIAIIIADNYFCTKRIFFTIKVESHSGKFLSFSFMWKSLCSGKKEFHPYRSCPRKAFQVSATLKRKTCVNRKSCKKLIYSVYLIQADMRFLKPIDRDFRGVSGTLLKRVLKRLPQFFTRFSPNIFPISEGHQIIKRGVSSTLRYAPGLGTSFYIFCSIFI